MMCMEILSCPTCGRDPRDHAPGCPQTDTFEVSFCGAEATVEVVGDGRGIIDVCAEHARGYELPVSPTVNEPPAPASIPDEPAAAP